MGLTSALYTGLSGLNANQFRIDTIGDNIANANTVGFKGSRSMFQTQFAQMISQGTPPGGSQGGTNGLEVGLGAAVGATQRNMQQGSTEVTGLASDLAIDGQGFFVVRTSDMRQAYTRDGSFMLNSDNHLVAADGNYVQGYGVDSSYNLIPGVLSDLKIPLGRLTAAKATSVAQLEGNLSSEGDIGTQGSQFLTGSLIVDGGAVAGGATLLTSLRTVAVGGVPLFANGDVIKVSGIDKGSVRIPDSTFVVGTDGATVADFTNWLQGKLGINTAAGVPGSPGVAIDPATGIIRVTGNIGADNALTNVVGSITNQTAGTVPFTITAATDPVTGDVIGATGSSVRTTFQAYDSLGALVDVRVTMVLESKGGAAGNVWRYFAECPQNAGGNPVVGTGTITIADGAAVSGSTISFQIDRTGTGAQSPMVINMDASALTGMANSGSAAGQQSSLMVTLQDGFGPSQLSSFSIGTDGVITGTFSNGLSQTLGQIALGTFANPAGLTRQTGNLFYAGPNSGQVAIGTPDSLGAGRLMSGALELSNVDLSREFIGLINASSGFSASSRVITTSNQLLNDLMQLMR
jgi:flagellar hook protein FlgE